MDADEFYTTNEQRFRAWESLTNREIVTMLAEVMVRYSDIFDAEYARVEWRREDNRRRESRGDT